MRADKSKDVKALLADLELPEPDLSLVSENATPAGQIIGILN